MKLSTKLEYVTRALLDLALYGGEERTLLREIAQRQQIPLRYLEQLIRPLLAGRIVRSARGTKGGISLARPPEEIKLSEVMQLIEGSSALMECIDNPEVCGRSPSCATREVWSELGAMISGVLDGITLRDLMERQKQKEQAEAVMYYI
ncbi:MAG TPA: Rrf2 family transcriptional regulator [Dehalococcoidia bacterium]|nr:Rrf2 family transcriptional regulator [Dehalococcoidia bacterium]